MSEFGVEALIRDLPWFSTALVVREDVTVTRR